MFCKQCGMEIPDGTRYCKSCGAETGNNAVAQTYINNPPSESNVTPSSNQNALPAKESKKNIMIPIIIICVVVAVAIVIGIFGNGNAVKSVKNGTLFNYPEKTIGDAFEEFFIDTNWSSYRDDGDTYVKFTGKCTYDGELTKAKIIFLVDDESFHLINCTIGDLYLSTDYEINAILDVIYE